jgi:hypothetical protein
MAKRCRLGIKYPKLHASERTWLRFLERNEDYKGI